MARIKVLSKASDLPDDSNDVAKRDLQELFAQVFPGQSDPEFKESHIGWGILAAQSPQLALKVAKLTKFIAGEMSWFQRQDLRQLAIQTVNVHFRCDLSFQSHLNYARAAGVGAELFAAIPYWRTTTLFNEEQRLVVQYTFAVVTGAVPDALFAWVVDAFGERQAIELTTVIAHWSFWAMILNAIQPDQHA